MRSETMPTPEQIDEQVKLEREAISCGLKRLQDQTIKLEDQSYASATIYGISSIDTLLPLLIERIEKTNLKIRKGKFGVAFKDIHSQLASIDTESAAVKYKTDRTTNGSTIYSSFGDQLDMLYHDIVAGKLDTTGTWATHIKAVKDANPKP